MYRPTEAGAADLGVAVAVVVVVAAAGAFMAAATFMGVVTAVTATGTDIIIVAGITGGGAPVGDFMGTHGGQGGGTIPATTIRDLTMATVTAMAADTMPHPIRRATATATTAATSSIPREQSRLPSRGAGFIMGVSMA